MSLDRDCGDKTEERTGSDGVTEPPVVVITDALVCGGPETHQACSRMERQRNNSQVQCTRMSTRGNILVTCILAKAEFVIYVSNKYMCTIWLGYNLSCIRARIELESNSIARRAKT
jgi:hypothetical protein